ncbi:two-component sensor histidine kinase, partial [Streptomyces parvus]
MPPRARACRQTAVVARRAAGRRMVRAIARRRNGLVAELLGHFGNAASVRARRRP